MGFDKEYFQRGTQELGEFNPFTHALYDVMWALAFALNHTMTMVESEDINSTGCQNDQGSLVPLHEFNYSNEMMGCLMQWNLQRTNFSGLTVTSFFFSFILFYFLARSLI